ncbi:Hypothetical protein PFR_JS4_108 [Propionibacterium freudenreichii]|nr:Hypothetical protein PFR_JS4_108 [Propionibacterium freudenreichii]
MRYYFMIQEDPRSGGPGPRGHHGHGGCGGRRDFDGPRGRDFGPRGGDFEGPRGGGDLEGPRDGFGRRGGRPGFGGRGEGDPRGRGEAGGFGGDGFGGPSSVPASAPVRAARVAAWASAPVDPTMAITAVARDVAATCAPPC